MSIDINSVIRGTERRLKKALQDAHLMVPYMQVQKQDVGFGGKIETFNVMTIKSDTSFHPVADDNLGHAIVIYISGTERGFALYNEDMECCVPIEISAVTHMWEADTKIVHRDALKRIEEELQKLLRRDVA